MLKTPKVACTQVCRGGRRPPPGDFSGWRPPGVSRHPGRLRVGHSPLNLFGGGAEVLDEKY